MARWEQAIVRSLLSADEELLYDNAFGLENYLIRQFSRALANAEEDAFLNGDGTGKPLGIFAEEGGGEIGVTAASATEITADEIITIYQVLPQLIELWGLNVQTNVEAKKNFVRQNVK